MDKRVKENTTVVTSAEASAKASAQAAQETADRFAGSVGAVVQNANARINASKAQVDQAKAEVDETVTTVAQAVQTANNASASAQQSANTVATYDTRLTETETKNTQQDTAISALQTADGQNVKLDTNQVITGHKKFVQLSTAGVPLEAERKGNGAGLSITQTDQKMTDAGVQYYSGMYIYDGNGNRVGGLYPVKENDNRTTLRIRHNNTAGETRELVVDGDFILSNSMVSKGYVESTDGETNNLVHRTANERIIGYKQFEYSPSIKKIYVNNNNLTTKWVRLCYYKENNNYEDMHMITRFISGHTTDADFMFTVDIKQRSSHKGRTLVLLDNASTIPLCINKAPVMEQNNCGLVALWVPNNNVTNIEIWGKLPSNRLCITVQNYANIMDMPTAEGVYMDSNTVGFDIATSFVTWDCNTYSDTLPSNATRTQYLQTGKEDVQA